MISYYSYKIKGLLLHNSQVLRDVKKKSTIFSPKGRSNVIKFLIYHIAKLPKNANYALFLAALGFIDSRDQPLLGLSHQLSQNLLAELHPFQPESYAQ